VKSKLSKYTWLGWEQTVERLAWENDKDLCDLLLELANMAINDTLTDDGQALMALAVRECVSRLKATHDNHTRRKLR
jgi:hypothetical protein